MNSWKDLDVQIQELDFDSNLLRARLDVCILTKQIDSQTSIDDIQQLLLSKFNVEYNPSDLIFQMKVITMELHDQDSNVLESEDYFEGF